MDKIQLRLQKIEDKIIILDHAYTELREIVIQIMQEMHYIDPNFTETSSVNISDNDTDDLPECPN